MTLPRQFFDMTEAARKILRIYGRHESDPAMAANLKAAAHDLDAADRAHGEWFEGHRFKDTNSYQQGVRAARICIDLFDDKGLTFLKSEAEAILVYYETIRPDLSSLSNDDIEVPLPDTGCLGTISFDDVSIEFLEHRLQEQ
jgi:hypothetical protein